MKILVTALMVGTIIAQAFIQPANAAPRDRNYKHQDSCMYRGYPCSEWNRDDGW